MNARHHHANFLCIGGWYFGWRAVHLAETALARPADLDGHYGRGRGISGQRAVYVNQNSDFQLKTLAGQEDKSLPRIGENRVGSGAIAACRPSTAAAKRHIAGHYRHGENIGRCRCRPR